jgi:hypothetical protein
LLISLNLTCKYPGATYSRMCNIKFITPFPSFTWMEKYLSVIMYLSNLTRQYHKMTRCCIYKCLARQFGFHITLNISMHHNVSFKHIYSSILKGYHIWNNTRNIAIKDQNTIIFLKHQNPTIVLFIFRIMVTLNIWSPKVFWQNIRLLRDNKRTIFFALISFTESFLSQTYF